MYDLGPIMLPNPMSILNFQSLMLQSYQPKWFTEFLSFSSYAHTSFPTGICYVFSLASCPSSPGQCSTALQVLCLFSYCFVASHRLISLLQRYIILVFLSVLPVSNPSLLVHSTSKPVLRSAKRLLRINQREDHVLRSHSWASVVTQTTLSSTY